MEGPVDYRQKKNTNGENHNAQDRGPSRTRRLDGMPIESEVASRAVVSDDGREIRLTLYAEAGATAAIVLDPVLAVALAQRLIAAALPRLCSPSCNWQPSDGSQNRPAAARGRATADESGGPVPR
jgi:hypothetical protein